MYREKRYTHRQNVCNDHSEGLYGNHRRDRGGQSERVECNMIREGNNQKN